MTRERSRERLARRESLVSAARDLALDGGYAAVTMHDVADQAGVGRATVYRYFASKDHLLTEVAADWARRVTEDLDALTAGETAAERLNAVLERIVRTAAAQLTLTSAIVQAVTADDPSVDESRTGLFLFVRDRLAAALGDPVPGWDEAEVVLGHVLLAALISLASLRRPVDEVAEMVRTSGRLVLAGAVSRAGSTAGA